MAEIPVAVDLFYSGAWNDITALGDVLARDPIQITRDARPGAAQSAATLSIANTDGRYSPRLPTSALYGLIGRNTPLRISVKLAQDTFTRSVTDGWGTSSFGHTYNLQGGTAADYDVTGTVGTIQPGAVGSRRFATVETNATDFDIQVELAIGSTPASGTLSQGVVGRFTDINNYFLARVRVSTTSTVTLLIDKRVAGVTSTITSVLTGLTHSNGVYKSLRFRGDGPYLWAKVWDTGSAEPTAWTLSTSDTALSTGTRVGVYAINDTAVTTHVFSYDNLIDRDIRFTGEVESWPQRWNVTGNDVWAPINAFGIMRRLGAPGTKAPALSALRRAMLVGTLSSGLLAYWPFEDGSTATTGASAVDAVPAVVFTSAVTPAAITEPQGGTLPYAVVDNTNDAFAVVQLPTSTAGFFSFSAVGKGTMPLPTAARAVIYWPVKVTFTGGDISDITVVAYARWTGTAFDTSNTGLDVLVTGGTSFGSVVGGNNVNLFDGHPHDIHARLDQTGADVVGELWVDGVMVDTATSSTKTLGTPAQMYSPTDAAGTLGGTTVDNNDTTFGFGHYAIHAAAAPPVTATDVHDAATGHTGETAADRISRLCGEDGIAVHVQGTAALSEPVGIQRVAPFLELCHDAAQADGGPLFEPRGFLGLAYRTFDSLYNQTAAITLDYAAAGEVAPPLTPVEDTQHVANDITVTRYLGSSSRAVQETGTLNVAEPSDDPQGVGRIPKEYTLVLAEDSQTVQQAFWRRHLGTWDEARYPRVNMDLSAMEDHGKSSLAAQAAELDMGDRLVITNPPSTFLTYDDIEQHAQGFAETIETHHRMISADTTPALPYNVGILDDTTWGRLDNDACTLNEALDTTETGVDVISVTTPWGSGFNYDINIGGERMTVTNRSGAGLTQTLTVTRSVNGVVKSHSSGASVRLWNPLRLAR